MAWVYSGAPSYGHLCNTRGHFVITGICGLWTVVTIWKCHYLVSQQTEFTKSETTPTEPNSNN